MNTVLVICLSAMACIGIGCFIGDKLFDIKGSNEYIAIMLYDNPAEVEQTLNRYIAKQNWKGAEGKVLLLDMGMGEKSREICQKAMSEICDAVLYKMK